MKTTEPEPGLFESFIPVIVLVMGLGYAGVVFGNGTVDGPAQMLLILSGTVASLLGIRLGVKWEFLEERILESLKNVLKPVLILLLIGSLIGVWVWSGIVPSMIVWGLKLLKPSLFLITACLLSSVVSLITGSSWSTVGTVGVALMGIGTTLDVPPGIAAGAVVSGAYFGDKLSPFSETTNLASSIAGTPLFTHIQHMLYTTLPAFCIAIIFFTWMGFDYSGSESGGQKVNEVIHLLERSFRIHPVLLFPPVLTFVLIYFKVPAIPSILAGILSGGFVRNFSTAFRFGFSGSLQAGFKRGFQREHGEYRKSSYGCVTFERGNGFYASHGLVDFLCDVFCGCDGRSRIDSGNH